MIRLSTFVGLALASVAAGLVMHVSYRVQRTEQYLAKLEREIVREQDQIRVLDAEWSYLNDPARIEALARRHLVLGPMSVKKIVSLDAIPMRDPNTVVAPGPLVTKTLPVPLKPLEPTLPSTLVAQQPPQAPTPPVVAAASAQLAVAKSPPPAPVIVAKPAQPAAPAKLSARDAAAAATRAAAEAAARSRGAVAKSDPIGALVLTGGTR